MVSFLTKALSFIARDIAFAIQFLHSTDEEGDLYITSNHMLLKAFVFFITSSSYSQQLVFLYFTQKTLTTV